MTFAAILYEGYLDDVQEAAEALRHWHAERILAESAEIDASAPVEFDDEDLDLGFVVPLLSASGTRRPAGASLPRPG